MTMTERRPTIERRPWHLGTYLGLSIGAYATVLAAVTGTQASADAALAASRAPAVDEVAEVAAGHDRLEGALDAALDGYAEAADRYTSLARRLAALDHRTATLAATVAEVAGSAAALPERVVLPTLARSVPGAPVVVAPPPVHATTGASG